MFHNHNHNNSVSISLSDEESDELGRMRIRARRKRKKLGNRRLLRKLLLRYWMLLVIVPAAGLLIFEATRIGRSLNSLNTNSHTETHTDRANGSSTTPRKEPPANLNRLDPTTHVVGGVRERKYLFSLSVFRLVMISVRFVMCG